MSTEQPIVSTRRDLLRNAGAGFGGLTLGYFPDPRTYGATFGVKF